MLASSLFIFSSSILVTIMSIANLLGLVMSGYMEMNGNNKQYAKFFDANASKLSKSDEEHKLPSRNGMLIFYTPAFVVGVLAFTFFPHHDTRFVMVIYVLTIHFLKRILEVLFVHKFSGSMMLNAAITIGVSYAVSTMTMIYDQYLSQESPEPSIDLKYVGLGIFLIGITGNFYHHYILSNLRKKGDKEYKIPKGGLFDLVICAHYFFEIVGFIGSRVHFSNNKFVLYRYRHGVIVNGKKPCHTKMVRYEVWRKVSQGYQGCNSIHLLKSLGLCCMNQKKLIS